MTEFHGIFCHPFLLSVLLIEGVGGRVGWAGVEGGKISVLDTL